MKILKIGLVGYARSGKDTVFEMIQKMRHEEVKRLAFGDDLVERFHQTFPDIPKNPKPRNEYNIYGQAVRSVDAMFFIRQLEEKVNATYWNNPNPPSLVITDIRQPNEADWAIRNGFILIKVYASERDRRVRSLLVEKDKTFSPVTEAERHLHTIPTHYVVYNEGDKDFLQIQVENVLKEIDQYE